MTQETVQDIPTYYYRDNFLRLCDSVEQQYEDLLHSEERAFLSDFRWLSFAEQCLYVRLISRTGPWFRESRLSYPEIGEEGRVIDALLENGFVRRAQSLTPQELAALFTQAELRQACAEHIDTAACKTKASLLCSIEALQATGEELLAISTAIDTQRVVAPEASDFVALLQLLFFGNRHQSMTDFLLQDLGVVSYYPYSLDSAQRMFSVREAVDEYLYFTALADRHREIVEADSREMLPALANEVLARTPAHTSSRRRWDKLCNHLARDLERQSSLSTAKALYECSMRHPSRERRARIHEQQNELAEAISLCETILDEPWCEAELEAAGRILPRAKRKLNGTPNRRRQESFPELSLTLPQDAEAVEISAARALAEHWTQVHYVENTLMNALFGLAFWEQIFAPLPGAFTHPYQSVPLDMYDRDFRLQRKDALSARITHLAEADLTEVITGAYARYQGYQCHWVNWKYLSAELVAIAVKQIPRAHLLAIWERLLFDPGENRKGFPDLVAFGDQPGEYAMIEVKGPGDKLQDSQKHWLRFFIEQDIPAQVAWVNWLERS